MPQNAAEERRRLPLLGLQSIFLYNPYVNYPEFDIQISKPEGSTVFALLNPSFRPCRSNEYIFTVYTKKFTLHKKADENAEDVLYGIDKQ